MATNIPELRKWVTALLANTENIIKQCGDTKSFELEKRYYEGRRSILKVLLKNCAVEEWEVE